MKKNYFILALLFTGMFVFSQQLQFNHYSYSDVCEIITDNEGKIFTRPFYSDKTKEIFLKTDKNGFRKLENDEYNLFIIDGMNIFISPEIETFKLDQLEDAHLNGRAIQNIKASSTLKDKYHTYSAEGTLSAWYTGDCDSWGFVKDNIPWVESKEDYGIGEYIEFDLNQDVYKRGDFNGWTISLLNGYVNPEKPHLFKENSRLKSATLIVDGKQEIKLKFNDYVEILNVQIPGEAKKIKLIIDDVYKGSKYKDTCITGISASGYY